MQSLVSFGQRQADPDLQNSFPARLPSTPTGGSSGGTPREGTPVEAGPQPLLPAVAEDAPLEPRPQQPDAPAGAHRAGRGAPGISAMHCCTISGDRHCDSTPNCIARNECCLILHLEQPALTVLNISAVPSCVSPPHACMPQQVWSKHTMSKEYRRRGFAEQQGAPAFRGSAPSTGSMSSNSDRTQADSEERPQARPALCLDEHVALVALAKGHHWSAGDTTLRAGGSEAYGARLAGCM